MQIYSLIPNILRNNLEFNFDKFTVSIEFPCFLPDNSILKDQPDEVTCL